MNKRLIVVNGTMGAGKTATSLALKSLLPGAAFLDGDWCWTFYPDAVNPETQGIVVNNITHMLRSYLLCQSAWPDVIFCWVMHQQPILDSVLAPLADIPCERHLFTVTCTPETLAARFRADAARGLRDEAGAAASAARLPLYDAINTVKIATDNITPVEAAQKMLAIMRG